MPTSASERRRLFRRLLPSLLRQRRQQQADVQALAAPPVSRPLCAKSYSQSFSPVLPVGASETRPSPDGPRVSGKVGELLITLVHEEEDGWRRRKGDRFFPINTLRNAGLDRVRVTGQLKMLMCLGGVREACKHAEVWGRAVGGGRLKTPKRGCCWWMSTYGPAGQRQATALRQQ